MIKAVFFDIDGTLKGFNENELNDNTMFMLESLHQKGIKCFIATGRPPIQFKLLGERMNSFKWDGKVMLNGQYCVDENDEVFYKNPIKKETLEVLVPWLKENMKSSCSFMELDYSYDLNFNESMYNYLKSIGREKELPPIDDPLRALNHDTYQICPYIDEKEDEEFLKHAPGMKSVRWSKDFADMIPVDGGKPIGIQKMLEHYHLSREETMAFGDGGNDIEMLKFAQIGVAMGNASDKVKVEADYVTDECEKDGIYNALKHFEIL